MLKCDTIIHIVLNLYVFGVNLRSSISENPSGLQLKNAALDIYNFCVMFILLFICVCVK